MDTFRRDDDDHGLFWTLRVMFILYFSCCIHYFNFVFYNSHLDYLSMLVVDAAQM